MSNLSEIIDRLERVGQGEGAHALRHVRDVAEQRQADLVAKDDRIRDYMNICEDLSRKLEEARGRIGELEAALTPSPETKFAYSGEVNFWHTDFDDDDNEHRIRLDVPWTSIKVLMKLIRQKADERAAHRAMIKAEKEQNDA